MYIIKSLERLKTLNNAILLLAFTKYMKPRISRNIKYNLKENKIIMFADIVKLIKTFCNKVFKQTFLFSLIYQFI